MAGLSLTFLQAYRLFDLGPGVGPRVLATLVERGLLQVDAEGLLVRKIVTVGASQEIRNLLHRIRSFPALFLDRSRFNCVLCGCQLVTVPGS
jgi:hypothetical protein